MPLIFQDGFWVVHIPLVHMVKFKLIARLPVEYPSHPVMPSLTRSLQLVSRLFSYGHLKFTMLLLYILWDDWPIMISGSNQQLQQQLQYTLLKPDCHSWWISKMQSGHEDTLEELYAIKLFLKLGKNTTETYGMLQTAFGASCMSWSISFWVALEIQGRQGVCEGWWAVCEE